MHHQSKGQIGHIDLQNDPYRAHRTLEQTGEADLSLHAGMSMLPSTSYSCLLAEITLAKPPPTQSSIPMIKNALRPFFNRSAHAYANLKRPAKVWTSFNTIRRAVNTSDMPALFSLVEEKGYYPFPGLGNTYPRNRLNIPDATLARVTPIDLHKELSLQIARINHHASKLGSALDIIANINALQCSGNWSEAEKELSELSNIFGYSVIYARKAMLTAFQIGGLVGMNRQLQTLTAGTERRAWSLICSFFHDIIDPAYHPTKAVKVWLHGISKQSGFTDWYTAPLLWQVAGFPGEAGYTATQALRYNSVSLIDLLLYIWSVAAVDREDDTLARHVRRLDPQLLQKLHSNFRSIRLPLVTRYEHEGEAIDDVNAYRVSFFFSEIADIAAWKADFSELLVADVLEGYPKRIFDKSTIKTESQLAHVLQSGGSVLAGEVQSWTERHINRSLSGNMSFIKLLLSATAVRHVKLAGIEDSDALIKLISRTNSLQDHVSAADFIFLSRMGAEHGSPLLAFLLRDLAFKRQRTQDNDLERRTAFMEVFLAENDLNIPAYVANLAVRNVEAADYVFAVCSRIFLEKLYLLMSSVKDVIETRIELCEWYVGHHEEGNEQINEELSALRRELENLDARSDLDSTRVHVDEEALREWYGETQYGRAARYTQTVVAEGDNDDQESFLSFYNRISEGPAESDVTEDFLLETQIGSKFVLLQIVEDTLKAFVSDKAFGMDAYLSRRIRHGTLSGFLITPVSRTLQRLDADMIEKDDPVLARVKDTIEAWRGWVVGQIDFARRELIQIKSATHPEGLINPTWRVLSGVTYLDAMNTSVRSTVLGRRGDYDIFPEIHGLCWDLVERDLAKVRLYLLREFSRNAAEHLGVLVEYLPAEVRSVGYGYFLEAQNSFLKRVQEVCGWFIRPVVRKDRYDLRTLVGSMISIVRELDASYNFTDVVNVDNGININRGTFEVLGDVLFVLLGNAAKHGTKGGTITVEALGEDDGSGWFNISVTSQNPDDAAHQRALKRIQDALSFDGLGELEAAAVQEGFSGIRKMVGVLNKVRSDRTRWQVFSEDASRSVTFVIRLPSEILFKQERA